MLPLATSHEPGTATEFIGALTKGLSTLVKLPRAGHSVVVEGDFPDKIERLIIDLNGAEWDLTNRPQPPTLRAERRPGIEPERFRLQGLPMRVGIASINLEITGEQLRFEYQADSGGRLWLVPAMEEPARSGALRFWATQKDIQELVYSVVSPLTREHGITLEDVRLVLQQKGSRSLGVDLKANAKKFMMRAAVQLRGTVEIDNNLNAVISDLHAGSEGMIGTIVSNLLEPRLQKYNGTRYSLAGITFGGLRLHDITLNVTDTLRIEAAFGAS